MNILITGGASGLGEAIMAILAKDTANKVFFTYSSSADKARAIQQRFVNAIPLKCDFTDPKEVDGLIENINGMDLDILINNAYKGDFLRLHFNKIPANVFLTEFTENLIPTIRITQAAITIFRKKKQGKIITILTSALVNVPPAGSSVYIANKSYLQQLTKVWASENAKFNITSNSVSPSFIETNMTAVVDERIIEQIKENHPLKKLLTTTEVAESVKYLVGASSQINGIDIVINAAMDIQ